MISLEGWSFTIKLYPRRPAAVGQADAGIPAGLLKRKLELFSLLWRRVEKPFGGLLEKKYEMRRLKILHVAKRGIKRKPAVLSSEIPCDRLIFFTAFGISGQENSCGLGERLDSVQRTSRKPQ